MYEVELKYAISNVTEVVEALTALSAHEEATQFHEDTYYRHPCRDFASTGEALRIRRCDGIAFITYKGPKQIVSSGAVGGIKLRRELEWSLEPGDTDGRNTDLLFESLGFSIVARVHKQRRPFRLRLSGVDAVIAVDEVDKLGSYVEIEVLCSEGAHEDNQIGSVGLRDEKQGEANLSHADAVELIGQIAERLGVQEAESRSYLRMVLEAAGGPN